MTQEAFLAMEQEFKDVLTEYEWLYNDGPVRTALNNWYQAKKKLRGMLSTHPMWNDDKQMIVFTETYNRKIEPATVKMFATWVMNLININNLSGVQPLYQFVTPFVTMDEEAVHFCTQYVTAELEAWGRNCGLLGEVVPKEGQKTSRAWRNILNCFPSITEQPEFKAKFAELADALNPLATPRYTCISINPIDFLLSSNGNSWSSCMTIDKFNKRNLRGMRSEDWSGSKCAGTLSLMGDNSTFVVYTLSGARRVTNYELECKVLRQFFHYDGGKLLQNRLYPQQNDGCSEGTYENFRTLVQEIIAKALKVPNLWTLRRGASNCRNYTESEGAHYRDYREREDCNVSLLTSKGTTRPLKIGSLHNELLNGSPSSSNGLLSRFPAGTVRKACRECGGIMYVDKDSPQELCNACATNCSACGAIVSKSLVFYHRGNSYCPTCGALIFDTCSCGRKKRKDQSCCDRCEKERAARRVVTADGAADIDALVWDNKTGWRER